MRQSLRHEFSSELERARSEWQEEMAADARALREERIYIYIYIYRERERDR